MKIKETIDHKISICYVVSDVEGMTFDDIVFYAETEHGQSWRVTGYNVNNENQPWIMLENNNADTTRRTGELKFLFFFLKSVDEASGSAFEQCIESWEIQNARLKGTPRGNIAKLPWTY